MANNIPIKGNIMILRFIDALNETIGKIVSTFAIIFAGIILYDICMRYLFNQPIRWAFDVSKQLFGFYFIMLGAYALKHNSHVRVDLLIMHFHSRLRQIIEILGYLVFFFPFTWVFLSRSYDFALRSWAQNETTYGAVQIPVYPLKMAMVIAAALLLLQGIAQFIRLCAPSLQTKTSQEQD